MTATLTSCAGVLSILEEDDPALQTHALERLNGLVDEFWMEMAKSISTMYVHAHNRPIFATLVARSHRLLTATHSSMHAPTSLIAVVSSALL
jgi:hypothetical protein